MKGETNLKFQVSLFGDFSHITPTEDIIKNCITAFFPLGMLPGGNVQEMDPATNRLESRLSLQSMRNGMSVNFLVGRIDFLVMPLPTTPGASLSLEEFSEQVLKITEKLIKMFGVSFNRIGFVTEKFLAPLQAEKLELLRRKFITDDFSVFPEKKVSEWGARNVVLDHFGGNVSQEVNVIHNIAKVKVQMGDQTGVREFETIHLVIDINTPPEKRVGTSIEVLSDFISEAKNRENLIYNALSTVTYAE